MEGDDVMAASEHACDIKKTIVSVLFVYSLDNWTFIALIRWINLSAVRRNDDGQKYCREQFFFKKVPRIPRRLPNQMKKNEQLFGESYSAILICSENQFLS